MIQDEEEFHALELHYKQLLQLDHICIVKLQDIYIHKQRELCSSVFESSVVYQYLNHDLQKDIEQR